jgi:hypothetical protein
MATKLVVSSQILFQAYVYIESLGVSMMSLEKRPEKTHNFGGDHHLFTQEPTNIARRG